MKTISKTIASILLVALTLTLPGSAAAKGKKMQWKANQSAQTSMTLTAEEQDNLLWMREEEKLARDVYKALYKTWRQRIFKNIARSEQKHMNAILKKIKKFNLDDPALPQPGQFSNATLQEMYDDLVFEGQQSYVQALTVGATIEDLDIRDLMVAIDNTKNLALKNTYQNLLEASKKHLRAFVRNLQKQGEVYTPQFISQDLYNAIISV